MATQREITVIENGLEQIRMTLESARATLAKIEDNLTASICSTCTCSSSSTSTKQSTTTTKTGTKKPERVIASDGGTEPWTCADKYLEAPTDEFTQCESELFDELLVVKETNKRTWVSPVELQHLIRLLHTFPESRLSPEDIRICVSNWLETAISVGRGAPRYPNKMWETNKHHGVPYWQSNLDYGKESMIAKASPSKRVRRNRSETAMDDFVAEAVKRRSRKQVAA
jgi:hypothetical protein